MTKRIKVFLDRQVLVAYENGKEVFKFDCATGDRDHPTDIGVFPIFKKDRKQHRGYILSYVQKVRERGGKKITTRKQACSVIEERKLKKSKEMGKMKRGRAPKSHRTNLETVIHSKLASNLRRHSQWPLMIKPCLLQ